MNSISRRERGATLVSAVAFKRPPAAALRFAKVTRVDPEGMSGLSIAAQLPLTSGRVTGARIAYAGMAPMPLRAKAAERALEGRTLDAAGIAPALAVAATERRRPTMRSQAPGGDEKSFPSICADCCSARTKREQPMKTPIQFRLNGEDVATFADGGANLLDVLREWSAICR